MVKKAAGSSSGPRRPAGQRQPRRDSRGAVHGARPAVPPTASPIDAVIARLPPDRRALLLRLRRTIHAAVPGAEECLSYGIPAFRLEGRIIAGFAATSLGGSYYPFSGTTLETLAADLEGWSRTRSALHFSQTRPLPVALVRKLLATRRAELHAATRRRAGAGRRKPARRGR